MDVNNNGLISLVEMQEGYDDVDEFAKVDASHGHEERRYGGRCSMLWPTMCLKRSRTWTSARALAASSSGIR